MQEEMKALKLLPRCTACYSCHITLDIDLALMLNGCATPSSIDRVQPISYGHKT